MAHELLSVFSDLNMNDVDKQLQDAEVSRIITNRNHTKIRIYMDLNTLVPAERIRHLEKMIKDEYFPEMDVRIIEKFHLSEQYTPEKVYENYRDSILQEIYANNRIMYQILKGCDLHFEENRLTIVLVDDGMAHVMEQDVVDFYHGVFCDRCGFSLIVNVAYKEGSHDNLFRQKKEEAIKNRLHDISVQVHDAEEAGMNAEGDESASNDFVKAKSNPSMDEKSFDKKDASRKEKSNPYEKGGQDKENSFRKAAMHRGGGGFGNRVVRSTNPDVIYGREIEDESVPLETVRSEMEPVCCVGQIMTCDSKQIRNEKHVITFCITDFTDSIHVKIFVPDEYVEDMEKALAPGKFVKVQGTTNLDTFMHELVISSVRGIMKSSDWRTPRSDNAVFKRVELHCHTKMSDMDGVSDVADIIKQAAKYGHRAIAITDHGNVQAFPNAAHAAADAGIQVIYGMEAYLVDDTRKIVTDSNGQTFDDPFVVFDIETTGFSPKNNKIIEIGAVRFEDGKITDRFSEFVNPETPIPYHITELTSITDADVMQSDTIDQVLPRFLEFSKGAVFVAHNANFDMSFIRHNAEELGLERPGTYMDTIQMARISLPSLSRFNLDAVGKALNVVNKHHHRAVDDAEATAQIFEKLMQDFKNRGMYELDRINNECKLSIEAIRNLRPFHCIILAKNDLGRINLYRLVTMSNLTYFKRKALIPKSQIIKHREGLILGSACSEGELYPEILEGRPQEEIEAVASFYDYLEIQPVGNNAYLLRKKAELVKSPDDLREINRKIVELGKKMNKPVCATCDVHFLNPEDEIYRRIIQYGKFDDADHQPPLYLHTTDEMLDEFSYLGPQDCQAVVIDNPNKIADMCEPIEPVRPDKCPPVIENSDSMLRKICNDKAHAMYGEVLPEIVQARLDRELNSIISNGYAVMYIIAQKLVWKSVEDGYLVGSRGSVGSSFVATMAGITEVNPLSAHYLCPHCHYVDFDSDEVKEYAGRSGCDMPDKKCPKCGHYLSKEGFDIPFETFLGFKGNKEPDIDLNFSNEYQSKAHRYTEVIFGEGQTFKAGTIGTLADKTAYGYIKNYFKDKGIDKRNCEVDRIVPGCVGVRRTTGQHPGGIVVLPVGEEINTFTPVQHPADDITSDVITTHFDYHKIEQNLLKLDILGHLDPTVIRMLEDLTGLHATDIPLDDRTVMTIFQNVDALELKEPLFNDLKMGTLGIPEFGTDFAMQMLIDAKPTEFSDLIRISGLSHGTDVWLGNAKDLILSGQATISTAICCRDDIMVYLIIKGLDSEESFTIMERVRKGVVAKGKCKEWPQYVEDMKKHGVPDWYIESCKKIKYMFPKAHAAAYVMMAWRVAYCKVYYPLAYYAAYFTVRTTAFDYETMCQGKDALRARLQDIYNKIDAEKKKDKSIPWASNKEKEMFSDGRSVDEMYCRGYDFLKIDLYKSDARHFQIVDGKLLPPFNSIEGMGDTAAESLQIAAAQRPFLSKTDLRERGKVPKTVVETMERLGIIKGLPEDNQLSFFDMM